MSFNIYSIFRYPFNQHGAGDYWRKVKWGFQRMFRGYDDTAVWGLNGYLTDIIHPVLKRIKEFKAGHPASITSEEWDKILDELIWTFEYLYNDDHMVEPWWTEHMKQTSEQRQEDWQRIEQGLQLFGRWYNALWT